MRAEARGRYPYLDVVRPFGFAHRGGSALHPENTLLAFEAAVLLGFDHIETDLHLTRDGVFVIFHDPDVGRTTDGAGAIREMTLAEVKGLDAGHRFVSLGGGHPHRGRGVEVPTLDEALARFPDTFFNLEMKHEMARPLWRFIEERQIHDRVLVGCADDGHGRAFRALARGRVPTSPGVRGVLDFWLASRVGLDRVRSYDFEALQVPPHQGPLTVVDRRFVAAARRHGIQVHVWTIDDRAEMRRLFGLGVDAVMSDRPDLLRSVLADENPR
ncbi:MAG: glycerophosphodiester phosphodiesterase [Deltaproteobacteria bacterium]|nr:MAG: glycerophosphodiester phosphodiesterase [Deltaproteobacteria bacterium]